MRTYGQYCSIARSLDLVGDRWTLLVVRELLTRGPSRYNDLRRGLPGIATNLLATRLREMEAAGLVERRAELLDLTPRGRELRGVVRELVKFGAPEMACYDGEEFRMHWLSMPARFFLTDHTPAGPSGTVRFGELPDAFDVRLGGGASVEPPDPRREPDVVVDGPPPVLVATVTGAMPLVTARAAGLVVTGDVRLLERTLPRVGRA